MVRRSSFAFACGSTLTIAHQSQLHSAAAISVSSCSWDHHSHRFNAPRSWQLPLAGDVELLSAAVVENYEIGECLPHLVIRDGSILLVGVLSIDEDSFTILTEVTLPLNDIECSTSNTTPFIEECWIMDGPIIVALSAGNLLLACPLLPNHHWDICKNSDLKELSWNAYAMDLKDFGEGTQARIVYCGDLKNFTEPELFLSIQHPGVVDILGGPQRSNDEWIYVRLPLHTVTFSGEDPTHHQVHSSKPCSWKIPLRSTFKICNELFPHGIHPNLISCVEVIPADPSSLVASLSGWQRQQSSLAVTSDIAIGSWEGKVLRCRLGCVMAEVDLKDIPVSLQFAVVADGQGVLLAVLDSMENKVVALCAENLEQLQVWAGFQAVVIGDFQMMGHEQILLLQSNASECKEPGISYVNKSFTSMQITDLKMFGFVGLQQPLEPGFSGVASNDHKAHSIKAISKCLQTRMEAGIAQMTELEKQRAAKAELVHSSCELMQAMIMQHDSPEALTSGSNFYQTSKKSQYLQVAAMKQGTCGRTWFLIVDIHSIAPRDVILHQLSIMLTSIQGQIAGISSIVESLGTQNGTKRLIVAVPLRNLPMTTGLPVINILLTAQVSRGDHELGLSKIAGLQSSEIQNKNRWLHTEWLCQVKFGNWNITRCLEPGEVPIDFRAVAPQYMFGVRVSRAELQLKLLNIIQTALQMKDRLSSDGTQSKLKQGKMHEMVATNSLLWADSTIFSFGEFHLVILRAEDSHYLLTLKARLRDRMDDDFDFFPTIAYPESLSIVLQLAESFREELMYRKVLLAQEHHKVNRSKKEQREMGNMCFETSCLAEAKLQIVTDKCCSLLLRNSNFLRKIDF